MKRALIALVAFCVSWATPQRDSNAYEVAGWQLRSGPSYCMIGGPFQESVMLGVHVSQSYQWGLTLTEPNWKLGKGVKMPVTAHVDGRLVASGQAEVIFDNVVYIALATAETYKALQNGNVLVLVHPRGALNFSLAGSARAMNALLDCVRELNGVSVPPQTAKSFGLTPDELKTILVDYMEATGESSYKITGGSEGTLTFALADGTLGHIIAARGDTKSADEYTAFVIGEFAQQCPGQFASSKKEIPSTNGTVIRQIEGACRNDNGATVEFFAGIVRSPDGTLIRIAYGKDVASNQAPKDQWQKIPRTPSDLNAVKRF